MTKSSKIKKARLRTTAKPVNSGPLVIVLGAGASRSVSYGSKQGYPSFLDHDFFDLLQRWNADHGSDKHSTEIRWVLDKIRALPNDYWRSMEKAFYTLHLRALLAEKLDHAPTIDSDDTVVGNFAVSAETLLRAAHGRKICNNHKELLSKLTPQDTIITFNYDLVVERAVRERLERDGKNLGPWFYALNGTSKDPDGPRLIKLHGSSNWQIDGQHRLNVRTKSWQDFDDGPGYRAGSGEGTEFPIFLPFWDKRIEIEPWLRLWKTAYQALSTATRIIVWGYSLPPTDIKAQHLFSLSLGSKKNLKFCIIDPAAETRERWRQLLRDATYWEYDNIKQFFSQRPKWW